MNPTRFFRDAFFITTGTGVGVTQLPFISHSAQPVLVFLAIFLLGCAPAFHVDESAGGNPWVRLFLSLLGDPRKEDPPGPPTGGRK
jgi:hypothetical protein